jgi:hypothetical protein
MSSGNIVTGLTVEGDVGFEVAKDPVLEKLMASAMFNDWDTKAPQTGEYTINAATKTLQVAGDDFEDLDLKVGDFVTLSSFDTAANNVKGQIIEIVSNVAIRIATKNLLVNETKIGAVVKRADRLEIGTAVKSFSMEKNFISLTNKATIYKGMIVNSMNLNVNYGEILNGTFSLMGTEHLVADTAGELITNGRVVNDPATTNSLNGSIDMPILITSALGALDKNNFCIQSLDLTLNNNLQAQNCIGRAAPINYTPGTAEIEINLSTYLDNVNWPILEKKLSQEPFSIGFVVENFEGFYGFFLPAIQVSFPDPSSAGANQEVSLEMSGSARVGLNGESALVVYRG